MARRVVRKWENVENESGEFYVVQFSGGAYGWGERATGATLYYGDHLDDEYLRRGINSNHPMSPALSMPPTWTAPGYEAAKQDEGGLYAPLDPSFAVGDTVEYELATDGFPLNSNSVQTASGKMETATVKGIASGVSLWVDAVNKHGNKGWNFYGHNKTMPGFPRVISRGGKRVVYGTEPERATAAQPATCAYTQKTIVKGVAPEPLDWLRDRSRETSRLFGAQKSKYDAPPREQEQLASAHVIRRAKMKLYNGTPFCDVQGVHVDVVPIVGRDSVQAALFCPGCAERTMKK